jgi:pyridinium-3,5-bisthiocarboxylic acid mononucleotide nickel chelatase
VTNSGTTDRGNILYFDCYSGISGDMTLGALLDLGLDLDRLRTALAGLPLGGYRLSAEKVMRGGLSGTRLQVIVENEQQQARHLPQILALINEANLPDPIKKMSGLIFNNLAEAEAAVHGTTVDQVHFHEVGAVDAIVDIVGTAAALHLLEVTKVYSSPLPMGSGEIKTAHGVLPLPAPATLELLARRKATVRGSLERFELVTPTGAAIITTIAKVFGPLPDFTLQAVGYGAGSYELSKPNFLRLLLGQDDETADLYTDELIQLEANMDDLNPEIYGYLIDQLFACGALDVFFTPIQMKKNRPAVQLTVLTPPHLLNSIRDLVFRETSTLGLRLHRLEKVMKPREIGQVETKWGVIRIKYCPERAGEPIFQYAPEYEDCCQIARLSGLPLKEVYRLAEHLFRNNHQ